MAENKEQSWATRSGRDLTDAQFAKIHKAASALPDVISRVYAHIPHDVEVKFANEFLEIRDIGASPSRDDAFAVLQGMTKNDVTPAKEQWFKKIARLYRRAANALMQRPLDETSVWTNKEMQDVPTKSLSLLADVLRNMHAMESVYPPEKGIAKST